MFLSSCNGEQGEVEEVMLELLENGESVVVEPLEKNEIDAETKIQNEHELKQIVAEVTGLEEDAIRLMISLADEPSCSIVLPTEQTVEESVIEEIQYQLISKLLEIHGVVFDKEHIVITNNNKDSLTD